MGKPIDWIRVMWKINGALTGAFIVLLMFLATIPRYLEYVEVGRVGVCNVLEIEPTVIDCPEGYPKHFFGYSFIGEATLCREYEHRASDAFVIDYKCFKVGY